MKKTAGRTLSALFDYYLPLPFPGKMALALVFHQAAYSVSGLFLPTAQIYFKEHNLDPAIVEQITDRTVRIREREKWFPYLHALHDIPTAAGPIIGYYLSLNANEVAYAIPHQIIFKIAASAGYKNLGDECYVTPQAEKAHYYIILGGEIHPLFQEYLPLTDEQMKTYVLLHEIAHCTPENQALEKGPAREAHADYVAIRQFKKIYPEVDIEKATLYFRALTQQYHSHDAALYLDALLKGKKPPTAKEMKEAYEQVLALAKPYLKKDSVLPAFMRHQDAYREVLKRHADELSPLARHRAGLYIEAVEYFVPSMKSHPGLSFSGNTLPPAANTSLFAPEVIAE